MNWDVSKRPRRSIRAAARHIVTISLALIAGAGAGAGVGAPAAATQQQPAPLKVVIKPLAPFVTFEGERNTGFSIDLWNEIAQRLDRRFEFVRVGTVKEQLDAVRNGGADVAITGISITAERETSVDFSLSYFDAGLQILVPAKRGGLPFLSALGSVFSSSVLPIIGLLIAALLIIAHVYWLFERRADASFPRSYLAGVGEGLWWACVTLVTVGYGDRVPKGFFGRAVAIFWMFLGLFLVSNFTATITSEITLRELQGQIRGESDLPGKRVVTVANTTAARYLTQKGIAHTALSNVEEGYARLETGQADALVFDAPVLLFYSARAGSGKVLMAGEIFNPEAYGIAFAQGSPLREDVNRALLAVREDGTYHALYERWFGVR